MRIGLLDCVGAELVRISAVGSQTRGKEPEKRNMKSEVFALLARKLALKRQCALFLLTAAALRETYTLAFKKKITFRVHIFL